MKQAFSELLAKIMKINTIYQQGQWPLKSRDKIVFESATE